MTWRKAILLLGVFGIFFAFACPLAPTPTAVWKMFLLVLFVLFLAIMTRHVVVISAVAAYVTAPPRAVPAESPQVSSRILLC